MRMKLIILLISLGISLGINGAEKYEYQSLFNGKNLEGWETNQFAGGGEVRVENGKIEIGTGLALTGIKRKEAPFKINYEILVKAKKIEGDDFFCGITFPVKESHCTFIAGGWGGSLVGISSIDGMDASENEATQYMKFEKNKWYEIRIRVTESKIEAWINGEKLINANIKGRRISMRPGEIEDAAPFGISTYQTTSEIEAIKVRPVPAHIPKIAMIAGKKSHGPGEHEYEKSLKLLQQQFEKTFEFIDAQVFIEGWPFDQEKLLDADTIVLFTDGADHDEKNDPLLLGNRLKFLGKQMDRGAGLVCLHYSLIVPADRGGKEFLQWVGGYFDYETGPGENHWYSKIENRKFNVFPASPEHPICEGMKPMELTEEYYFKLRFADEHKKLTPIITFDPEKKDWEQVVGWTIERANGGRGFGYTGGHYYKNFENPEIQEMLMKAILWTAHAEDALRISASK